MCVSINNEMSAAHYLRECLKAGSKAYAERALPSWQSHRGWLKDYEIVGRALVLKAPKVTGDPGVAAVSKAVDEVMRVPAFDPRSKRVRRPGSVEG